MTTLERPATPDGLFLWVMHRFASLFDQHAILRGGMALRLLDSPRSTTDIDYVFVPYTSKREVKDLIEEAMAGLVDASVEISLHSKMIRARVRVDDAQIQIEINVATQCPAIPMATGNFARSLGKPSQVVAVMHFDTALAEKVAAWNERRLIRDLYDCYFLVGRLGTQLDLERLDQRLSKIESRVPSLRNRKQMTRRQLAKELKEGLDSLEQEKVEDELRPLFPPEELPGLALRIRASLSRIVEELEDEG
ncbi:MAG: nucleotidyl transferase AbiEii/AbiGii toxin family protein [Thermoanaerobaculia bacterium]